MSSTFSLLSSFISFFKLISFADSKKIVIIYDITLKIVNSNNNTILFQRSILKKEDTKKSKLVDNRIQKQNIKFLGSLISFSVTSVYAIHVGNTITARIDKFSTTVDILKAIKGAKYTNINGIKDNGIERLRILNLDVLKNSFLSLEIVKAQLPTDPNNNNNKLASGWKLKKKVKQQYIEIQLSINNVFFNIRMLLETIKEYKNIYNRIGQIHSKNNPVIERKRLSR